METNNTVLTDEEIRALFPFSEKVGAATIDVARAVESAVLAKLPGMQADEWKDAMRRAVLAYADARIACMRNPGGTDIGLAYAEVMALIAVRIQPAASESVIDTCEEGGHKFAKLADHPTRDGRPRCPHCMAIGLDRLRAASEAGAVPVEWRETVTAAASDIAYAIFNLADKKLADLPPGISESTDPVETALIAERNLRALVAAPPSAPAAESAEPEGTRQAPRCPNCGESDGKHWLGCPTHIRKLMGTMPMDLKPPITAATADPQGDERARQDSICAWSVWWTHNKAKFTTPRQAAIAAWEAALSRQPSAAASAGEWREHVYELCAYWMSRSQPMTDATMQCAMLATGDQNKHPNPIDALARAALAAAKQEDSDA